MEMVLQQSLQMAGVSGGGCRPGPRPATATAPMMAMATAVAKEEPEPERETKDNADGEEGTEEQLRRGPWTVGEDLKLINYIADHGEGRWNALARAAGLRRTGKSCRLRWLNYLRPDVKRGDFTADEQLLILDLHSRWGNRWSKIAAHLPGRTDNEIKNYWRTRVQKHAKQLNCDVNSKRFKDAMRFLWMPRLAERAAAHHHSSSMQQPAISGDGGHGLARSALASCFGKTIEMMNGADDRSPSSVLTNSSSSPSCSSSHTSSEYAAAAGHDAMPAVAGDDWAAAMQQSAADQEFWSTASALQQLTAAGAGAGDQALFHQDLPLQDLSGWVQGFSEGVSPETLWSLDDIFWRTQ